MSRWAPIVHGRTKFVDYRSNLIAVPDDFEPQHIKWALSYIIWVTANADGLRTHPSFAIFKSRIGDRDYCIAGVACMARDVCSDTEFTEDSFGRGIHIFLGMVTTDLVPAKIPPLSIKSFQHLYSYIVERWYEKEYEVKAQDKHAVNYSEAREDFIPNEEHALVDIHAIPEQLRVFHSDEASHDQLLWSSTLATPYENSLCLGMESEFLARRSPYQNVSIRQFPPNRRDPYVISREIEPGQPNNTKAVPLAQNRPDRYPNSGSSVFQVAGKTISNLLSSLLLPDSKKIKKNLSREQNTHLLRSQFSKQILAEGQSPKGGPPSGFRFVNAEDDSNSKNVDGEKKETDHENFSDKEVTITNLNEDKEHDELANNVSNTSETQDVVDSAQNQSSNHLVAKDKKNE